MDKFKCIHCGWPDWIEGGPDVEKIIYGSCSFRAELVEMDNKAREKARRSKQ